MTFNFLAWVWSEMTDYHCMILPLQASRTSLEAETLGFSGIGHIFPQTTLLVGAATGSQSGSPQAYKNELR